ncbi:MAG: hypothetical protein BGP13_15920 [Sphingobacteriales bacterium 40-81]|nr:MAG: hypothetical protein BGP13_15920 [Sphingobacteriales bacterium 40-81]
MHDCGRHPKNIKPEIKLEEGEMRQKIRLVFIFVRHLSQRYRLLAISHARLLPASKNINPAIKLAKGEMRQKIRPAFIFVRHLSQRYRPSAISQDIDRSKLIANS